MRSDGQPRVLVVDDEAAVRETLEAVLTQLGYAVDLVASGAEALRAFDPDRHRIVLLDLLMPKISGWEVLQDVRQRAPSTPVIVITGTLIDATDPRLRQAGIVLVRKPVELRVLEEALERVRAEMW